MPAKKMLQVALRQPKVTYNHEQMTGKLYMSQTTVKWRTSYRKVSAQEIPCRYKKASTEKSSVAASKLITEAVSKSQTTNFLKTAK
jgi:hypothetical protein